MNAQNYFNRFGPKSLLVAKFGAPRFIACTLLGSVLWSLAALGAGWYFQDSIGQVLAWLERFSTFAFDMLAAVLALYVGWKAWRRRAVA